MRGVLAPLLKHRPAPIVIANRTLSKAKDLAGEFAHFGKVEASGFKELKGKHFDIVMVVVGLILRQFPVRRVRTRRAVIRAAPDR